MVRGGREGGKEGGRGECVIAVVSNLSSYFYSDGEEGSNW